MVLDVLHLLCPTAVIHAECFEVSAAGYLVEAGLREQKQCPTCGLLQSEFHERGRLLRIIYLGVDAIRMPGKRKEPLGLHFLHDRFPFDMLIARMSNLAARDLTRYKRAVQLYAKPLAKLAVIRQRTPDPRNRRFEFNTLFNAVIHLHATSRLHISLECDKKATR